MPLWRGVDRRHEAVTLGKMAEAFRSLGDFQEAVHFEEKALSVFVELDDKPGQAAILNNIALAKSTGERREKSLRLLLQARALYRGIGDSKGEATTLINIAAVYSLSAKQNEALVTINQALQLSIDHGYRAQQAEASSRIGAAYAALGQERLAHEFCDRAIAVYRELGDDQGASRTREVMASFDARSKSRLHKGQNGPESAPAESLLIRAR